MKSIPLTDLAGEQLAIARQASSGRAATTVYGSQQHDLRQTVIALAEGRTFGEHESPGETTLQMLVGCVRLVAGDDTCDGTAGAHLVVPPSRHELTALTDAVVLLAVATGLSLSSAAGGPRERPRNA